MNGPTEVSPVTLNSLRAPLVPMTLAFLLGIFWQANSPTPALGVIGVALVSAAAAWWRRAHRQGLAGLLMLWVCLGILRTSLWQAHPAARLIDRLPEEPTPVSVHGLVRDDPRELFDPDEEVSQQCVIELRHVRRDDRWVPMAGRVWATLHMPAVTLTYGDEVLLDGRWAGLPGPGNPGQYDWRAAMARQHVHGRLQVRPDDGLIVLRRLRGTPWLTAALRLRHRWAQLLEQHFEAREVGLLRSLLLGQRTQLDEELKGAFVETGTIHLLVISGSNVALVAGFLELGLRLFGLPWRLRLACLAMAVGGYELLTGAQPPVVRATLMAWIVFGAAAMDRVLSWPNALAAAALAILWVDPAQLFDAGFQLSFGAVLSLLVFTGRWCAWLEPRLRWIAPLWLRRYVAISLSGTTAVWVGLWPLLARYFHLIAPISILANLLIAPPMSALIALGTGLLMLGTVCEAVVRWGGGLLRWLLAVTVQCVMSAHAVPGGYWFMGQPPLAWCVGYYGLVGVSALRQRLRWAPSRILLCWLAGLTVWIWSAVAWRVAASHWCRVDVLDVGHGDSLVIRTPRGQIIVVDAGSREAGRYRLLPFLRHQGIGRIDALVLTHTDEDHLGGAIPLLQELRVERLLTNGVRGDTMSARQVRRVAARQRIPLTVVAAGSLVRMEGSIQLDVLHPPRGLVPGARPASNDNSIVLKLTDGGVSILLCGDIEEAGLPWLLQAGPRLRSTVLKVPHHGSRLGEAGPRFFTAVQPRIALLSVGRTHHLPAPETVAALRVTGAVLYSTRDDGAIQVRTDGHELQIQTYRSRQNAKHQIPSPK